MEKKESWLRYFARQIASTLMFAWALLYLVVAVFRTLDGFRTQAFLYALGAILLLYAANKIVPLMEPVQYEPGVESLKSWDRRLKYAED